MKCGLLNNGYGRSLGLVALARPGTTTNQRMMDPTITETQQQEYYKQQGILVLQDETLLNMETAAASSTAVRKAIRKSPQARLEFLDARVEQYLRENAQAIGGIYQALANTEPSSVGQGSNNGD